jgi:hypothetical protein
VWGADPLAATPPSGEDVRVFGELIDEPDRLFVSYANTHEQFPGINGRLRAMLANLGARRDVVAVIRDTNGRPVYEVATIRRP